MVTSQPSAGRPAATHRRRWFILAVLCLSVLLVAIDNTIVNVALPTLNRRLGATTSQLQWVVDTYSVCFAGLLLVCGHIGDRFGRKRVLQIGLILFALASFAAARSGSVGQLVGARAAMGVAVALVYPSTLALLSAVFTSRQEKAIAVGVWSGVSGLAIALGPVVGGALLEHFWWGSIFIVNLPVIALALGLGAVLLPESRDPSPGRFDAAGGLLSVALVGLLIWTIIEAPSRGWSSGASLAGFAGAAVLLALFGWREAHPFAVVMGSLSPVAILIMKKTGTKVVVTVGMLLMMSGFLVAAGATVNAGYWQVIVVSMCLMAAGMALATGPATDAILAALPEARVGVGSAINDTTRELGGALGVAIAGSVMSWAYGSRLASSWRHLGVPAALIKAGQASVGAGLKVSQQLPPAATVAARESFMSGLHAGSLTVAGAALLAAIAAFAFLPARDLAPQAPVAPAEPALDTIPAA
jgi:MFS transporter, DHA2 family, multidrug resistance protein